MSDELTEIDFLRQILSLMNTIRLQLKEIIRIIDPLEEKSK